MADEPYQRKAHPRTEAILSGTGKAPSTHEIAESKFGRINSRVGLKITVLVGTMWCAYAFSVIALISLPSAIKTHNLTIIIAWISSNFLQLVLLPIIIVGQNIQATASDKRAESTYKDAEAVLHEALEIQRHLHAQDRTLAALVTRMEALERAAGSPPPSGASS